jgi:hypothetical protein
MTLNLSQNSLTATAFETLFLRRTFETVHLNTFAPARSSLQPSQKRTFLRQKLRAVLAATSVTLQAG